MIEKIITLFNKSGQKKIKFEPPIRIKMTPHSEPIWIYSMVRIKRKIRSSYIVSTSNRADKSNRNINSLNDDELNSLLIRLWSLFGESEKVIINHK